MENEQITDTGTLETGLSFLSDFLISAGGVASTADYWLGMLTSIIFLFVRHRIKLPKIRVTGSGGGTSKLDNGDKFSSSRITVTNIPSFFGYPISRETLSVASARIYDPATRLYEGHLMRWQGEPDNTPFKTEIPVGESGHLYICGVHNCRVHHYSGQTIHNVEHSETLLELGGNRKLEIHIMDKLQRRHKIPFRISAKEQRNHVDGVNVQVRMKTTIADRLRNFKYGFRDMIRAFTTPSY
jgi:hypothetical protein